MGIASIVVGCYGVFTLVGGVIGYLKAKSTASLIAGSISGSLLVVCAYGLGQGSRTAALVSAIVSVLLGGRFAGTWRRTHRVMPDLLMIVFSLVSLAAVGSAWLTT